MLNLSILFCVLLSSASLVRCQEDFDEHEEPEPIELTKTLDIGDGNTAWVLDNAISEMEINGINDLAYSTAVPESTGYVFVFQNYSKTHPETKWNYGMSPLMYNINIKIFKQMDLWRRIQPFVESTLNKPVRVERAETDFIGSMDPQPPIKSEYCQTGRYFLSIFLHTDWKHNSYGQVSFYSEMCNRNISDQNRLEITASVHPLPMRAVLWPSCHVALFRGPSVNHFSGIEKLTLWLNTNAESTTPKPIITPTSTAQSNEVSSINMENFRFTNTDLHRTINYTKCLTRTLYDRTVDRPIHVFDGLFTTDELMAWRRLLLPRPITKNGWDKTAQQGGDNVQWMSMYEVDSFVLSDMWKRLQDVLNYASNETEWYPYDVAVNYLKSHDHTRIHPDSAPHEVEFTLLLYLSEGFAPGDYGETNWVLAREDDGVHSYIGPGGDMFESIGAVAPKFGRLAVFRNNIEHSAHPPSLQYLGGRFTFAVKVSRNKRLNLVKRTYERMEQLHNMSPTMQNYNRQLLMGLHDDTDKSKLSTEDLEKVFKKVVNQVQNDRADEHYNLIQQITRNI